MNLLDAAERISEFGSDKVRYQSERCLHAMARGTDCQACWICPSDAISESLPPELDPSKCDQCLACLPACPTGAFSGKDPHKGILRCIQRLDARKVELLCQLHPSSQTGPADYAAICVGVCLAGLGSSAYLSMAAIGVEQILLRMDACSNCPLGAVVPQVEKQIQWANQLLATSDPAPVTILSGEVHPQYELSERQVWDAENPPMTRRDLFKMASGAGSHFITQLIEHENLAGNLGAERIRRVHAIRQLIAEEELEGSQSLEGFDYAVLAVDNRCTACGTCARICPTDALTLEIREEHFSLIFSGANCIACELCAKACTPEAITLTLNPTLEQVFQADATSSLIEGDLIHCIRCGARIADWTESRLCPVCEFRSLHPFGSYIPPGLGGPSGPDEPPDLKA